MTSFSHRGRGPRRCLAVPALAVLLLAASLRAAPNPGEGADGPAADRPLDSAGVVQAALRPARLAARPGQSVSFAVDFTVKPGWHLYAHGDTVFYGIALSGLETGPLAKAAVGFPAGEAGEFFGTPVRLLAGRQTITVRGTLPDSCREGLLTLPLGLEVQACDAQSCLAPARVPLPLRLEVTAAGAKR